MRQAGIGRELGRWGFEAFQEVKRVCRFDRGDWGWYAKAKP